jgi:hypothetical protein
MKITKEKQRTLSIYSFKFNKERNVYCKEIKIYIVNVNINKIKKLLERIKTLKILNKKFMMSMN